MIKTRLNYFQTKSKGTSGRMLTLLVLLIGTQTSWGQQPIGTGQYDGGFENATLKATNVGSNTPEANQWTFDSGVLVNSRIAVNGSNTRSGLNSFKLESNAVMSGKYVMSPVLNPSVTGGDGTTAGPNYTVQFYVKNLTGVVGLDFRAALFTDARTSGAVALQGTADSNGWQKVTLSCSGKVPVALPAKMYVGFGGTSISPLTAFTGYVDDLVVYQGALDATTPDAPTGPTVNGLNVSWTAPANGVDGGGYVVVRYATNPNADNDSNQNGVYAVGNTITNGTASLAGTVVYVGTAISFTDAVAGSVSGTDFYKIYTVDKAFNYSSEIMATTPLSVKSNSVVTTNIYSNGAQVFLSNVISSTQVEVFNMAGSLVKSLKTDADTNFDLNTGVYIVKAKSADGEKAVKVIVQ